MTDYSLSIPSDSNIPYSWKLAIESECSLERLIYQLLRDKRIDPMEAIIYLHRFHIWNWVIKLEWDDKHKLPKIPKGKKGKSYRRCYRILGQLYQSVVELCEKCHSFAISVHPYRSAAEWFSLILAEGAIEGADCLNEGKSSNRLKLQNQNRLLDSVERHTSVIDPQAFPHTWLLIEISNWRADRTDSFHKQYWHPFVQHRKTWAEELKRPEWDGVRIIDGKPRVGKTGRNTQRIPVIAMVEKNGVPEIQLE